jgi:hypothetical protein
VTDDVSEQILPIISAKKTIYRVCYILEVGLIRSGVATRGNCGISVDAISAFTSETPSSAGFDKGSEVERSPGLAIFYTPIRCFVLGHE